jgi:hypothetical protein
MLTKQILLIAALATMCVGSAVAKKSPKNCGGVERWYIKTASETNVKKKVKISQPATTTISTFIHRNRPGTISPAMPRQLAFDTANGKAVEGTYWIVNEVQLVEFKMEADSDIHLIVQDPSTHDLLAVEFPNCDCKGGFNSVFKGHMQAARAALLAKHGYPPKHGYRAINGIARVGGIGFFDKIHGSHGSSTEFHPALLFEEH